MNPVSRRELVRRLRRLGFEGPFAGRHHERMVRGSQTLILPNPHRSEIGGGLVLQLLREAGISPDEWEEAGR